MLGLTVLQGGVSLSLLAEVALSNLCAARTSSQLISRRDERDTGEACQRSAPSRPCWGVRRCLLLWASGRGWRWRAGEVLVDLAGAGALQAAQDVELGEPLVGPALDIRPGRWRAVPADQGDAPQGVVGVAVAAPVESVAVGAARGRRDGGGAAQMGEGGLGAEPLGVVAGGDQQLPGGVDPTPGRASRVGAAAATSTWSWVSSWSSSAWSCCQRRAISHSGAGRGCFPSSRFLQHRIGPLERDRFSRWRAPEHVASGRSHRARAAAPRRSTLLRDTPQSRRSSAGPGSSMA